MSRQQRVPSWMGRWRCQEPPKTTEVLQISDSVFTISHVICTAQRACQPGQSFLGHPETPILASSSKSQSSSNHPPVCTKTQMGNPPTYWKKKRKEIIPQKINLPRVLVSATWVWKDNIRKMLLTNQVILCLNARYRK